MCVRWCHSHGDGDGKWEKENENERKKAFPVFGPLFSPPTHGVLVLFGFNKEKRDAEKKDAYFGFLWCSLMLELLHTRRTRSTQGLSTSTAGVNQQVAK